MRCDCESGLRVAAVDAMPIAVFRRRLPESVLLAGLEKFKNASNVNLGRAATDQVRDRAAGAVPGRHRDRLGRGLGGRELLRLRGAHEAGRGRGVVGAEDGDGLRLRARLATVHD